MSNESNGALSSGVPPCSIRAHRLLLGYLLTIFCFDSVDVPAAVAPAKKTVRMDVCGEDDEMCFALHLSPSVARPPSRPRDIAILFDTSASQSGDYRDKALAALDATLAALRPVDRIRLFAVDLNAVPLMDRFASANDPLNATGTRRLAPSACRSVQRTWQRHCRQPAAHSRIE